MEPEELLKVGLVYFGLYLVYKIFVRLPEDKAEKIWNWGCLIWLGGGTLIFIVLLLMGEAPRTNNCGRWNPGC